MVGKWIFGVGVVQQGRRETGGNRDYSVLLMSTGCLLVCISPRRVGVKGFQAVLRPFVQASAKAHLSTKNQPIRDPLDHSPARERTYEWDQKAHATCDNGCGVAFFSICGRQRLCYGASSCIHLLYLAYIRRVPRVFDPRAVGFFVADWASGLRNYIRNGLPLCSRA